MNWKSLAKEYTMSAEQAIAQISSGQRVFIGSNCAEPQTLVEALTLRSGSLADTEIVHILTLGSAPYSDARFENRFRHNAFFIGSNVREAVNACRADYTPIFLSEVPALFRNGQVPLDYALISVSPPDAHGYCSMGVSVDVVRAATESATHIIAEINQQMPRTYGDSLIHIREFDAIVESDRPLPLLPPPVQNEVTQRIGRHIAEQIENGSTLQMGIGAIPDAVLACLTDKQDLGIHTEMLSDGVLPLIESGVINGRHKTSHPGKIVTSFCMGTRALYDFLDHNPLVEFHPTEYVNDPFVIAQNEKVVAINAAIEVDLTGQVCADSIGDRFYSGIGGQVDFLRGAARSRGGKPIIALPSTATLSDGRTISRIVSTLKPGAGVVTSRGDVHYVVTEWGVAYLHGKSIRERVLALISIAHPDFRSELLAQARARHLVPADITDYALKPRYPEELEEQTQLKDGTDVRIRPIRVTDEEMLREFHYKLSADTIFHRYGYAVPELPHADRLKLLEVDYEREMALVVVRQEARDELLAVGRYYLNERTRVAELAFTVRDDWQDKGIGKLLLQKLLAIGRHKHFAGFEAYTQPDNFRMVELLLRDGFIPTSQDTSGARHFLLMFTAESRKEQAALARDAAIAGPDAFPSEAVVLMPRR